MRLLAASFWLGALTPLFLAARSPAAATVRALLDAFSRLAMGGVAPLAVCGVISSWIQVRTWAALFSGLYGTLLLAKLELCTALPELAAYNKMVLMDGGRRRGSGVAPVDRDGSIDVRGDPGADGRIVADGPATRHLSHYKPCA